MLKAIVFDFDGLIADTETPEFESWCDEFRSHGVELLLKDWIQCVGAGPQAWDVFKHLEKLTGKSLNREETHKRRSARFQDLAKSMTVLPGVISLLDQADEKGLPVAIASSSESKWVNSYLARFEIADRFKTVVTRDQVEAPKPAPHLYIEACKRVGVDPVHSIALEDSVNGVTAAKAAGMTCIAVPNGITKSFDFSHADCVLNSLEESSINHLDETIRKSVKARS